jgi:hypothetical protein
MRHNQNRRSRGRSRKGPNPLTRSYESNGPDVKVRGTAAHVADKYMSLARDAQSAGDRVSAENYLQHAEHYNRIVMAAQAQFQQSQPQIRESADEGSEEDRQANGRSRFDYGGDGRGDGDGDDRLEVSGESSDDRGQRQGRRPDDQDRQRGQRQNRQEARQRSERNEPQEPVDRAAEPQPDVPEPASAEEAPSPPRRRRRASKASAEGTEAQSEEDSTKDGAAALAAFPE